MASDDQLKQDAQKAAEAREAVMNPTTSAKPWYKQDIGPRLKPAMRDLYKNYSGLADDEIIPHLHAIVRSLKPPSSTFPMPRLTPSFLVARSRLALRRVPLRRRMALPPPLPLALPTICRSALTP